MKAFDDPVCCDDTTGLERVRYFPRQLLTADDMRAEQEYLRQRQRRFNRFVIGWGVVCGLEVVFDLKTPHQVVVCPGYALGPWGDEIYVPDPVAVEFAGRFDDPADPCEPVRRTRKVAAPFPTTDRTLYVAIRYDECLLRPVRTSAPGCGCDETACEYSRIRDSFEIDFLRSLPTSHMPPDPPPPSLCKALEERRLLPCPPCPKEPWVVLATMRFRARVGEGLPGRLREGLPEGLAGGRREGLPDAPRVGREAVLERIRGSEDLTGRISVDSFEHRRQLVGVSRLRDQVIDCCCKGGPDVPAPTEPNPDETNPEVPAPITIDFETPSLGDQPRQIINPYVASGVAFTAESAGFGDAVVGLVVNKGHNFSACVPPESTNQLLVTGRSSSPEMLGLGGFKMRATLPGTGRAAPVTVSVEMQNGAGRTARMRLYDAAGNLLAEGTSPVPAMGKCPNAQGMERGRTTLTASATSGRVSYVILDDVDENDTFALDNFKVT